MCAAVPVALLLLVVLAALSVLRLSKGAPNARLLAELLDSLDASGPSGGHDPAPPETVPIRTGRAGAV